MVTPAPRFDGSQACAGADLRLFFPPLGGNAAAATRRAKQLCAGCRFLAPCFQYAMTAQGTPGRFVEGVWGGTTSGERAALRRGRGTVTHAVAS